MRGETTMFWARLLLAMLVTLCAGKGAIAQDSAWRVSKSSGDVWITTTGAQPAALTDDAILKPGDTIRTGQNGRVLLVRGSETILIAASSVVGIPEDKKDKRAGLSTILQQAGSILLDVEKRNVQHFEVLTPYLAAVVKGTQFRVTVDNNGSHVDVLRGQVQVTDYKTGQYALVNPDQEAKVSLQGPVGLSLSGSGTLSPIQQGKPRSSPVSPITIPNEVTIPNEDRSAPVTMPGNGLSVPDGAAPEPERRAQRAPASSDATSKEYGWTSRLDTWGKSVLGLDARQHRDDNVTLEIALSAVVGLSVAVGAGALRRKRRQRHK